MCVNPKLLSYPSLSYSPLVTRNLFSISVNLLLLCESGHLHRFWTLASAQGSLHLPPLLQAVPESNFDPLLSRTDTWSYSHHRRAGLAGPGFCRDFFPCHVFRGMALVSLPSASIAWGPDPVCLAMPGLIWHVDHSGLKPEESKAGPCSWHLHMPSASHLSPFHPSRLGKRVLPFSSSSSS